MGKQQDWDKVCKLRKVVKDMKTKEKKDPHTGKIRGGIILTDETLKPYKEELTKLEAKIAKDKEQMSIGERVDTAAAEVIADAEQNKDDIKEYIAEQFAKLAPKKFTQPINKWAYIAAKGSGDYYKNASGQIFPRKGDIPENCTFIHKVRVHDCIDKDVDMYKYFHEDGTAGCEKGIDSFQFISQIGMNVYLRECALPPALEKYAGLKGKIENEPIANKSMNDKDIFDISFPTKTKRGNTTVTRKIRREYLDILSTCKSDPHLAMKKTNPIIGMDEVSTACDSAGSSISSLQMIQTGSAARCAKVEEKVEENVEEKVEEKSKKTLKKKVAPVASVEWVKPHARLGRTGTTEETKATVQPYVDKVLDIFEKCKDAHKIAREIHILNRDMENYMDIYCRMKWFNEGRLVVAVGTGMVQICQVNVPYVVPI